MPVASRWGSDVKTVSRIDWTCDSNNTKPRPLNHACHSSGTACPPISGPSNISASIAIPASGPSGISASEVSAAPPASGPTGISAAIAQFNIAPLEASQDSFVRSAPVGNDNIKFAEDVDHIFINDGTDWHRFNEE